MEMSIEELSLVEAGGITASWISAISKGINSILELGRSLGSSVRRIISGKLC